MSSRRSTPYDVENHSAANQAFVDYFERLKNQGGHMSFLPGEERELEAEGWSAQRIVGLRTIIAMREERGIDRSGRTRSIAILLPPVLRSTTGCAECWS